MEQERYGYLGPEGTFSEMALIRYCNSEDKGVPLKTIREIVEGVKKGQICRGIIPLENSLEGAVNLSMDLLFREEEIKIIDEVILPVEQYLLAPAGLKINEIEEILSHRQAIAQIGDYISRNLPGVKITYTDSTAAAAELVSQSTNKAVVGSRRISDIYGLKILVGNISGEYENYTRFVVISNGREKTVEYKQDVDYKTSMICTPVINGPGVLYKILGEFANRGIDLTRIESRPTKKRLGEYMFYIDLAGHQSEPGLQEALKSVEERSGIFKVLGTYLKKV